MTITPRGHSFMVDVKVGAPHNPTKEVVRCRVTAKTRDEAIVLEAQMRAEIMKTGRWSGVMPGDKPKAKLKKGEGTIAAAAELAWNHPTRGWKLTDAKSGKLQHANCLQVVDFLGAETLCADVTEDDYNRAMTHFAETMGNSNDTVTRKLQAFSRSLWFAQKAKWIKARPDWERPTPGKPRQFIFSPAGEAQAIAYFEKVLLDQEMADLFRLGIDTGCRLGELLALRSHDVNITDRFLTVRGEKGTTKNGEVRVVILVDRAVEVLLRRLAVHHETPLFRGWTEFKVSRRMQMARAEFKPGDREYTFHATRHTCGTRMAERKVPLLTMMEQLGHKTAAMTQRYVKLSPAARRDAILESVGQTGGGQPVPYALTPEETALIDAMRREAQSTQGAGRLAN